MRAVAGGMERPAALCMSPLRRRRSSVRGRSGPGDTGPGGKTQRNRRHRPSSSDRTAGCGTGRTGSACRPEAWYRDAACRRHVRFPRRRIAGGGGWGGFPQETGLIALALAAIIDGSSVVAPPAKFPTGSPPRRSPPCDRDDQSRPQRAVWPSDWRTPCRVCAAHDGTESCHFVHV